MIRDITLGQYYPVDSVLHRMDPRTKLFGTLVFIVSLFFANSIACYVAATLFLITAIRMSKVPFSFMVRGLKAIVFLLLISVSFNLFLTPGTPVVQFGIFKITHEGIRTAGFMALRLIYLVIGSSVMTLTTTPNELTDGLEKSLGFLNKVGVPVHEVSMMMSIALRFNLGFSFSLCSVRILPEPLRDFYGCGFRLSERAVIRRFSRPITFRRRKNLTGMHFKPPYPARQPTFASRKNRAATAGNEAGKAAKGR